jgi:hypothetical protein
MPTVHSPSLENGRFPHVASLNEDDGWLRGSLKPSIVSRLRECHSLLEGEPPVEPLHAHASIGCAATAAGAFIALCVLVTKVVTGAAKVFGEGCLLRLSAVLMQAGAMLVGIGLLASVVRRIFLSGRLAIDRSKRTNIRVPRRM